MRLGASNIPVAAGVAQYLMGAGNGLDTLAFSAWWFFKLVAVAGF